MNVELPAGVSVNLYSATGVTVGVIIRSCNLTSGDVRLSISEEGLSNDHIVMGPYGKATNELNDTGAWAMSVIGGGINVREV